MSPRILTVSSAPSPRLLRACAAFGLSLRQAPANRARRAADASRILRALGPGEAALITGPSGGGKSSLLEDIARVGVRRSERILPLPLAPREAPIVDLIAGPLGEAIATLARAGLGDATLLARTPSQLSEGERFRLRLALAMSECASAPAIVLIDEFASNLDRTTARCLCLTLRRWLERAQTTRVIVATAHHDVAEWLAPEVVAFVPLGGGAMEFARARPSRSIRDFAQSGSAPASRRRAA